MEGKLPAVEEHLHLTDDIRKNIYYIMPLKSQNLFATVASSTLKIHVGSFVWKKKSFFRKRKSVKNFLHGVIHYLQCEGNKWTKMSREEIFWQKTGVYKN